jgi:hypothetical protein
MRKVQKSRVANCFFLGMKWIVKIGAAAGSLQVQVRGKQKAAIAKLLYSTERQRKRYTGLAPTAASTAAADFFFPCDFLSICCSLFSIEWPPLLRSPEEEYPPFFPLNDLIASSPMASASAFEGFSALFRPAVAREGTATRARRAEQVAVERAVAPRVF